MSQADGRDAGKTAWRACPVGSLAQLGSIDRWPDALLPQGLVCLMGGVLFLIALGQIGGADRPWFERSLVGLEVGPTGAQFGHSDATDARDRARFEGREIVRRAVAAHSEYLVLWARDGDYAYYDSKLLPKAPGLGQRDPLCAAVDEARQHQLPIIAYCVVQQGGHFLRAHPEWEMSRRGQRADWPLLPELGLSASDEGPGCGTARLRN